MPWRSPSVTMARVRAVQRALCHAVNPETRKRAERCHGRNIDNAASTVFDETVPTPLHQIQRPKRIDRKELIDSIPIRIFKIVQRRNPRIVDQKVDAPPLLQRHVHRG